MTLHCQESSSDCRTDEDGTSYWADLLPDILGRVFDHLDMDEIER
jgi:hypothetical protein